MAKKKGGNKKDTKNKGKEKKSAIKVSDVYEISGNNIKLKNKSCPKCGAGTFLANHKDRLTCGKCNYTEKK